MPSHDLYNTQILPVVTNCRYSNHFVEYVDYNYIQFISHQTNNLITSTVISAFVSDKTKQIALLTQNSIDKRALLILAPKTLRQKAREFSKVRHVVTRCYDIDLDDFDSPLVVISE